MNYQPLFDVMSQHGLTLLEGEMEEIVDVVNGMQQPKPKMFTRERFTEIFNFDLTTSEWESILPYLADEQPQQFTALGSTKPEPSRLEVAAMVYHKPDCVMTHEAITQALSVADQLIKQAKG